jgi:UDP-3-O-[3-hydroxymyristoyl] glucosamine N-acyltransferase
MKFSSPVAISHIAQLINATIVGNNQAEVLGINEIHRVEAGDLVFVDHPKYYNKCLQSAATFIIINTTNVTVPEGKTLLVVDAPFEAYQTITQHYKPFIASTEAISSNAIIHPSAIIMPNVFIGHHVQIGEGCVIHPNVVIHSDTIIGNNVVIQAGSIIGGNAFYYNSKKNKPQWFTRMHSCGNVIIEDGVEIGCNTTIDKGVTASTIIGAGTIIDNLVHIGHDVQIGKNCLLAAQVGIAGGTIVEDGVTLWGQVGVNKTITIGSGAVVLGQAGVTNSIDGNQTYWGTPIMPAKEKHRENIWVKRIPEIWKKIME